MKRYIGGLLILMTLQLSEAQAQESAIQQQKDGKREQKVIFEENFEKKVDTTVWRIEMENSPGSAVYAENNQLILNTGAGVTVWLRKKLSGNVMISYDRKIIVAGGVFDRLSDLNQFFMASELQGGQLGVRGGQLDEYNTMKLYYVGMGGNSNTTTRFRKYDGSGNRILLSEYKDQEHLLTADKTYHIEIVVLNGEVTYRANGELYFTYKDKDPLTEGYFGFRSTKSHQEISKLKIYQIR
ncbi:DUF6250 domain-containing protein [Mucilaginibacter sp. FT3.2]|uniref:DUF6250 domain-containing protein n=1 Tax=Mucilaginibacter sp. FT3.2 TaxID=2723090 RepID=UPI001620E07E|nr:DUF6250 domain-containing protein [Mucilaginibacter sp. FT3.2]MBB6233854.1 rhamnogalacturonan endolyase [Mucilaginibacter sp. FT3.2]